MRILLDTCTFLWVISDDGELSERARQLVADRGNECFLSSVSAWEIAVKNAIGKLPLPGAPDRFVPAERERHGISPLPLDELAALQLPRLPALHRDPFDRMLVCQALAGGLTILTPDEQIRRYPVLTDW
ncbi:MAG TPA: type II toxin-antitoxin system VapC family toxin [Polyangia bacterium]|nr:type II toxin-antitoxin system VapC family toxin [Polyangia bacterium]